MSCCANSSATTRRSPQRPSISCLSPHSSSPTAYQASVGEAGVAPAAEAEPEFVIEPEVSPEVAPEGAIEPEVLQAPEAASILTAAAWASGAIREGEPISGGARDLIEELEMSIGASPAPAAPVVPVASAKAPQWSAASIRLPIANFHPARRDEPSLPRSFPWLFLRPNRLLLRRRASPLLKCLLPRASLLKSIGTKSPRWFDDERRGAFQAARSLNLSSITSAFDLAAAAKDDGAVQADAALTEAAPTEIDDIAFDIDDLLADVSHYPVPERQVHA